MVKEVDEKELKDIIKNNPIVVVDYFTVWCGPCKLQHKILSELEKKIDIKIVSIDIDKNENLAMELGIYAIPTLQIFKNGNLVMLKTEKGGEKDRFVGVRSIEILEEVINNLKSEAS